MPVSSGTYTVGGTGGADYLTKEAAISDIAATLTGLLRFNQISNTVESVSVSKAVNTNGFDLIFDNLNPHNGVLGAGNIVEVDASAGGVELRINPTGTGRVIFRNLQAKLLAGAVGTCDIFMCIANGMGTNGEVHYHDMIFDNNGQTQLMRGYVRAPTTSLSPSVEAYNILFYDYRGTGASNGMLYFQCSSRPGVSIRNITVYSPLATNAVTIGIGTEGISSGSTTIKNCVSVVGGSAKAFSNSGSGSLSTSMTNCASSDSTAVGTGAITGISPSTEFNSIDPLNSLFLIPKLTSQLFEGGVAVSQTEDIKNVTYGTFPPIGAYVGQDGGGGGGGGSAIESISRQPSRILSRSLSA